MSDLKAWLAGHLIHQAPLRGAPFLSVREAGVRALAESRGLPLRAAMALCLEEDVWPERFRANRGTFSAAEQARLLACRVAVLGAGGLGGSAIILLTRLGVGRLTVVDGDSFDESNLNRQMLCGLERLGRPKALCAVEEAARINPAVEVTAHHLWAGPDNLPGLLSGVQVVVDALDNQSARYQAQEAARAEGVPFVHGSVAGLEGFVMVVGPGDPGLEALYGPTPAAKRRGAEVLLGVPAMTPAAVATLQVGETIKLLLGRRGLGPGKVLHLDLGIPSLEPLDVA